MSLLIARWNSAMDDFQADAMDSHLQAVAGVRSVSNREKVICYQIEFGK